MVILPWTCIHPYDQTSVYAGTLCYSRTHACSQNKDILLVAHKLCNLHKAQKLLPCLPQPTSPLQQELVWPHQFQFLFLIPRQTNHLLHFSLPYQYLYQLCLRVGSYPTGQYLFCLFSQISHQAFCPQYLKHHRFLAVRLEQCHHQHLLRFLSANHQECYQCCFSCFL